MEIVYSPDAQEDIKFWKRSGDKKTLAKISELIRAIEVDPFAGIGKPEALKYELAGYWSRRISKEHRVVYHVIGDGKIEVIALRFHY